MFVALLVDDVLPGRILTTMPSRGLHLLVVELLSCRGLDVRAEDF